MAVEDTFSGPTFRRPHHQAIFNVLQNLNSALLLDAECFFGGGTAITLSLNEYRESVDIDFLCASQTGYRALRKLTSERGIEGLFQPGTTISAMREARMDQYGIRTVLESQSRPIKFEIVREGRVSLNGGTDARLGVPMLSRTDMYVEKLLANADRWGDRSVYSRDIIDLAMMISSWGEIPDLAWQRARQAYDTTVDDAFARAVDRIRDRNWLRECIVAMGMDSEVAQTIRLVTNM